MASFYRFQRVRIVRDLSAVRFPQMVGRECTLINAETIQCADKLVFGWVTNIPHPFATHSNFCVTEDEIEPLAYLPDAADLEVAALGSEGRSELITAREIARRAWSVVR
jgi:hypothetical protein